MNEYDIEADLKSQDVRRCRKKALDRDGWRDGGMCWRRPRIEEGCTAIHDDDDDDLY
jgi:hypothetical protein